MNIIMKYISIKMQKYIEKIARVDDCSKITKNQLKMIYMMIY